MSKQGKGARARSKEKRKKAKQARKAAMQAMYQSWAAAGQNKKSKRNRKGGKKTSRERKHEVAYCGNLGCAKCHDFSNPWLVGPSSCIYGKRWTSRKWREYGLQLV